MDYPPFEQEVEDCRHNDTTYQPALNKVIHAEKILEMQDLIRRVPASSHVIQFAVNLLRSSRPESLNLFPS